MPLPGSPAPNCTHACIILRPPHTCMCEIPISKAPTVTTQHKTRRRQDGAGSLIRRQEKDGTKPSQTGRERCDEPQICKFVHFCQITISKWGHFSFLQNNTHPGSLAGHPWPTGHLPRIVFRCRNRAVESFLLSWILAVDFFRSMLDFLVNIFSPISLSRAGGGQSQLNSSGELLRDYFNATSFPKLQEWKRLFFYIFTNPAQHTQPAASSGGKCCTLLLLRRGAAAGGRQVERYKRTVPVPTPNITGFSLHTLITHALFSDQVCSVRT